MVLFSASSKVFADLFLSHHTSWHILEISCLIGHFLLLIISHFMLEIEERLDLSNVYRQYPKCILKHQDWHGKGLNFVKWWIKILKWSVGVVVWGFFTILFILYLCRSALFDSQRRQIAGCKKKFMSIHTVIYWDWLIFVISFVCGVFNYLLTNVILKILQMFAFY